MSKPIPAISLQLWEHCLSTDSGPEPDWKAVASQLIAEVKRLKMAAKAKSKTK